MYMKDPIGDVTLKYSLPIVVVLLITLAGTIHMGLLPTYYLEKAVESVQWLNF